MPALHLNMIRLLVAAALAIPQILSKCVANALRLRPFCWQTVAVENAFSRCGANSVAVENGFSRHWPVSGTDENGFSRRRTICGAIVSQQLCRGAKRGPVGLRLHHRGGSGTAFHSSAHGCRRRALQRSQLLAQRIPLDCGLVRKPPYRISIPLARSAQNANFRRPIP